MPATTKRATEKKNMEICSFVLSEKISENISEKISITSQKDLGKDIGKIPENI